MSLVCNIIFIVIEIIFICIIYISELNFVTLINLAVRLIQTFSIFKLKNLDNLIDCAIPFDLFKNFPKQNCKFNLILKKKTICIFVLFVLITIKD